MTNSEIRTGRRDTASTLHQPRLRFGNYFAATVDRGFMKGAFPAALLERPPQTLRRAANVR